MANFKELRGREAKEFADENLTQKSVDSDEWIIHYEDPQTGEGYVMDYPDSSAHGGGVPRLRRVD